MVAAEQVGMLQHTPRASCPFAHCRMSTLSMAFHGFSSATVTSASMARPVRRPAAHFDLARRVFIASFRLCDRAGSSASRLRAGLARRAARCLVDIRVAADGKLAQRRLQHAQAHHAPFQFLLGNSPARRCNHARGRPLPAPDGAGDVGKIALHARKGRQQGLHLRGREQGIAWTRTADFEARHAVPARQERRHPWKRQRRRRRRRTAARNPQAGAPNDMSCEGFLCNRAARGPQAHACPTMD